MKPSDAVPFYIAQVAPERWPRIRRIVDALADNAQRAPWQSILDGLLEGRLDAAGLLEARGATQAAEVDPPFGVVWIQRQDGRVANLLPPIVSLPPSFATHPLEALARELLEAAVRIAAAGGARLVQALLEPHASDLVKDFQQAGFQQVAELLYLVSSAEVFPTAPPAEQLQFEPWSITAGARLESMVERTYLATRDCPQLNGIRLTAEVLAGYRSAGPFDPRRWLLVRHAGEDVGCLILVAHPQKIWELAYMGLTPEARGHGWGLDITRHGQWLAGQAGANRFVLAVDATNAPALRAYAAAGLTAWDRRGAWLRILEPANTS
ncbi:MAG TPA: GNAT family N-acetyltransferase [Pirellulales bacterium]|jgi:GNAT superfamily N-acetyltransferase|nr:GNAT family N-acetyltransferase [Pirellulales bacterium]